MLKKIAHNSTIPALGGNRDLKALQSLIAAEKAVLISLQKLSVDYSKASEALRTWGLTEGDYLGGILGASTSILNHFSSALSQYAAHGHSMRDQLKAIRTKEESLDDLERRRRSILRKAEDADKKLSKMSHDSKHYAMQTDILNRLQDDIQTLDSEIMTEEAALDKFKRSATKVWMGLKFGGLVECCQKGTIAGEFGRLAIAEISEEMTQPGLPRHFVFPQNKIEDFVAEAYRGVNMVTLSTFPSAELRDRGQHNLTSSDAPPAAFYISAPTLESFDNRISMPGELQSPPTSNNESRRVSAEQPPQTSTTNDGDGNGYSHQNSSFFQRLPHTVNPPFSETLPPSLLRINESNIGASVPSTSSPYPQQFSHNPSFPQTLPPSQQLQDDLAANARFTAPPYQQRVSQGTTNPSFSQTLPSSREPGTNGGINEFGVNTHSTGPPYPQRFSQESSNSSFSQPPHQIRVTSDNFGRNVHPAAPPYEQRLSQESVNSSFSQTSPPYQRRVNENAVGIEPGVHSPHPQRVSQGVDSSFPQTLPPSQQVRDNEGAVGPNAPSIGSPHPRQFSDGTVSPLFSQTSPPSQRIRGNEAAVANFDPNVRPIAHTQRSISPLFSQRLPPSRVNQVRSTGSPHSQSFSQGTVGPSFSPALSHQNFREGLDENLKTRRSTDPAGSSSTAGGRNASFQVQTRPASSTGGYSLVDPGSGGHPPVGDSSSSASVANDLHENFNNLPGTKISPWDNQLNVNNSEGTTRRSYTQPANAGSSRSDSPLPVMAPSHNRQSPLGLIDQWTNLEGSSTRSSRSSQSSEYHGSLLAPVGEGSRYREMLPKTVAPLSVRPSTKRTTTTTSSSAQNTNEESSRGLRFGGLEDVDREIENRVSLEKEQRPFVSPPF